MSVLERVRTGRQPKPPKVVVYGPPKIGKSTFGAGIPDAIFLPTEEGIDALDVASFPKATSFQEVLAYIGALAKEEHTYRALVLDSLDWLEPLIWADVCRENNATSIELVGGGYGKGYVEATKQWRRLLDGLDYLREHKGMTVVLIGHDEIRRMEPPDSEPYDYAALKLHKRAAAIITEWADVIGYAHLPQGSACDRHRLRQQARSRHVDRRARAGRGRQPCLRLWLPLRHSRCPPVVLGGSPLRAG
jgi:hypothetical protein